MRRNRIILAAIFLSQVAPSFSQIRWTRDDLFLNPSGIPSDRVTSFAVADVDGDDWPDFALVQDGALHLYRQFPNALPRFRMIPDYFEGINFLKSSSFNLGGGIAFYDFDGDGIKNPITYLNGRFIYWRNLGNRQTPNWKADSSFFPKIQLSDLYYSFPNGTIKPSLGDFDGDGDADLITGEGFRFRQHDLIYFVNVGTNTNPRWQRDTTVVKNIREGYEWWTPRPVDADADGKLEIALAFRIEGVPGMRTGKYPLFDRLQWFNLFAPIVDMDFADLNKDGWPDLIMLLDQAGWRISQNLGNRSFSPFNPNYFNLGAFRREGRALPLAFDANRDGKAEFTLTNLVPQAFIEPYTVVEQNYRTRFAEMSFWQDRGWLSNQEIFLTACRLSLADLSGNRDFILLANGNSVVTFKNQFFTYRNVGRDSVFVWQGDDSLFTFFKRDTSYHAPAFADLDGDRDSDLLILHGAHFEFFENCYKEGRESWERRDDWMNGLEVFAECASFGDIDRDGDFDVVFGTLDGKLHLFENGGSSTNPRWRKSALLGGLQFFSHTAPSFGDFDGDGDADLLVGWTEDDARYFARAFGKLAYFRNDFTVGVRESISHSTPMQFDLRQNYPNPLMIANGHHGTVIQISLSEAGPIRSNLYNLMGQHLRTLIDEFRERGEHKIVWDGRAAAGYLVAPGIYLLRLENATYALTRKILVLP